MALSKVCVPQVCSAQVEIVQCSVVFDISSLILYGTHSLPVRMKILLDRLFSVLTHTQVLNIIHTLGWTLRDYVRGYMLQDSTGKVLDRWISMSPDDEVVTLRQFLRFGETKSIVELMMEEISPETKPRSAEHSASFRPRDTLHHFEDLPPGENMAFLQPFHYSSPHSAAPEHQKLQRLSKHSRRSTSQLACSTKPPKRHAEGDSPSGDSSGTQERSSLSKGRVSCDACAKTFYDKGTLKIHFNAVHLKIKHRCTVDGCNMMFSSLRSRNRHSANPNPRLHAAAEHAVRRFTAQPRHHVLRLNTSHVSMATVSTEPQKQRPDTCEISGRAMNCSANQNEPINVTPKKKSRKSSTPLKIRRDEDDDDQFMISPRQQFYSLHGNQSLIKNTRMQYDYKHLRKAELGYHSNSLHMGERDDWMQREITESHDQCKARCRALLKVKEELCDPTCDCRGHRHRDL
ncbi:zinc finger protein basonuclin-2 isoform X2 [Danio rerio]|uniref:Zinc finger protein basonuclin-2 isoform X2 n=1 Tax=Danio rerio TaxID=7955 RepID=A0AC58IMX6_DANRE